MPGLFSAMDISASGMAAERLRMETTASNIANANTTRTESGDPYRRKSVVFSSELEKASGNYTFANSLAGVRIIGVEADQSEFPVVYNPGHPHADEEGMVRMSNVKIPNEMVDLITSSRSYEANLRSISLYQEMVEQSLTLLQGLS